MEVPVVVSEVVPVEVDEVVAELVAVVVGVVVGRGVLVAVDVMVVVGRGVVVMVVVAEVVGVVKTHSSNRPAKEAVTAPFSKSTVSEHEVTLPSRKYPPTPQANVLLAERWLYRYTISSRPTTASVSLHPALL